MPKAPKITSSQCLQFLKKERRDEVDFLHADKHEFFLQVDLSILVARPVMPKVPKIASLQRIYNISRKKGGMQLIFYADKNQKFSTS